MNQQNTSSPLDTLPDVVIGDILSYCSYPTAVTFARKTSKSLRQRTERSSVSHIWQTIYERYNFAPLEAEGDHDYFTQTQKRRKLLQGLMKCDDRNYAYGRKEGDRKIQFHPLTRPQQETEGEEDEEAGIIQQDSFVCTSISSSPGIAMIDPYDGHMSVTSDYLLAQTTEDQKVQTLHLVAEESSPPQPSDEAEKPQHLADAYVGMEAKPIIDFKTNSVVADFLSTVRIIKTPSSLTDPISTELVTWTRPVGDATYSDRMSRHIPGAFRLMDIDANTQRVFISFQEQEESMRWMKWNSTPHENQVLVFPLLRQNEVQDSEDLPEPAFTIECEDEVNAFSVDCTGKFLTLATSKNNLEIWKVEQDSAHKVESIALKEALQQSIKTRLSWLKDLMKRQSVQENCMDRRTNEPCALRRQLEKLSNAPIQSIHLSKYSSIEKSGFITMHQEGRTLLHWRKVAGSYEIASIIANPLSTQAVPQVEYTGTKVILYGRNEDANQVSILVYQVATPDMRIADDWNKTARNGGGGVYNLCGAPSLRFINEIRPTAIRGIQAPKNNGPMHLTCNERFLAMNVMANEEWTGSSDLTQGLLVLDLEQ